MGTLPNERNAFGARATMMPRGAVMLTIAMVAMFLAVAPVFAACATRSRLVSSLGWRSNRYVPRRDGRDTAHPGFPESRPLRRGRSDRHRVVGSGIMGERLASGNVAVALLANTLATGAADAGPFVPGTTLEDRPIE